MKELASRAVQKLAQPHRPKPKQLAHPLDVYIDPDAPEPARDGVTQKTFTAEQRDMAAGKLSDAAIQSALAMASVQPPRIKPPPRWPEGLPRTES